jgi:flavin-dependent dehydrogenase
MFETDIAIIGGGPSGAAAALTLRRYTSHRVMIVERDAYEAPRVGETVSSAISALLDYLGASDCLKDSGAIKSHANAAAWGADQLIVRDHMFTGHGSGWHLERRSFDLFLADAARNMGATTLRNTRLRSASTAAGGGWLIGVDGENEGFIHAAQVVDASGRTASFARLAGATKQRVDHLVAVVAYFQGLDSTSTVHSTFVEADEHGWWYGAPLPHGKAIAMFMTDAKSVKPLGFTEWQRFYTRVLDTRHVSSLIAEADPIRELHIYSANSQRIHPVIGDRWVAVGDAAASFDPLSSLGIGHALSSGIQGARISDARLAGDNELADAYSLDVARLWSEFLVRRTAIYQAEKRWQNAAFWTDRHAVSPAQRLELFSQIRFGSPRSAD